MKRGMLVLILAVAFALATSVSLTTPAGASVVGGPRMEDADLDSGQQVVDVNSAADNGSDGDPGDAGDGYGATEDRFAWDTQGVNGVVDWEEALRLILLLLKIEG